MLAGAMFEGAMFEGAERSRNGWGGLLAALTLAACSQVRAPEHPVPGAAGERGTTLAAGAPAPEPRLDVPLLALRVADDDGLALLPVGIRAVVDFDGEDAAREHDGHMGRSAAPSRYGS